MIIFKLIIESLIKKIILIKIHRNKINKSLTNVLKNLMKMKIQVLFFNFQD